MTPEFYASIATGIALAGLILNNQRATAQLRNDIKELRKDMNALAERVNRDIVELREKMHREVAALDEKLSRDIAALGERIARLEGFMEGIRDAIAGKAA